MYVSNYCDTTCRKTRICIVTFVQNIRNTRHEYRSTLTRVAYSAMPLLLLLVPPPPLGRALPITKDARNNALRSTFTVTKNDARTISLLTEFSSPRSSLEISRPPTKVRAKSFDHFFSQHLKWIDINSSGKFNRITHVILECRLIRSIIVAWPNLITSH